METRRFLPYVVRLALILSVLLAPGMLNAAASVDPPGWSGTPPSQPPPPAEPASASIAAGDVALALERLPTGSPKLSSALNQVLHARRDQGQREAEALARARGLRLDDGRLQVVVETTPAAIDELEPALQALGGQVQTHYGPLLQALVPIDALGALAGRDDVTLVREPLRPIPASPAAAATAVSEGLGPSNASAWHAGGYTGAGVRVAVIAGGFGGYAPLLGGDLPASVTTYDWTGQGMGGSVHGTACAEIVHDMAPGAALDLHRISSDVELGNAVARAIADGVDVITLSEGFVLGGPGDGTGFLADIVASARANGIFFAVAAGNEAELSWSGFYQDLPSEPGTHRWPSGGNVNCFGPGPAGSPCATIAAGTRIIVALQWDDWTAVNQDYDLVLVNWDGAQWAPIADPEAFSMNRQVEGYSTPTELIHIDAPQSTAYGVVIVKHSATRDVCLRLSLPRLDGAVERLQDAVPARSISSPADSPAAIAVGAVHVDAPYALEPYSSRGPTFGPGGSCTGGFTKPDIAAYANVSTASYGPRGFPGTSAATPHVAGAAALVKQRHPAYTVSQLQTYLETNAVDLGAPGTDRLYGAGRLYLGSTNLPPSAPSDPSPADGATEVPLDATLSWTGGDPDPGDTLTYDVYLEVGNPTPTQPVCQGTSTTSCDPDPLMEGAHYYWAVEATDQHGASTRGQTWHFTTAGVNHPPVISGLPDQELARNTSRDRAIDLWAYAADLEDDVADLTFTISNTPAPTANVTIDANRYVDINPEPGWTGATQVEIRVQDTGGLVDTDTFEVLVSSAGFIKHVVTTTCRGAHSVHATDVKGNGHTDILAACARDNTIVWWENDGQQSFTQHVIDADFQGATAVYAVDLDGDGHIDLLGAADGADTIAWWQNDGEQNFTRHVIDDSFRRAWDVYAVDLDGDGHLDVLGAALGDNEIAWWENDGEQNFTRHTIDDSFDSAQSVYAADLTGDGQLDVLGAAYHDDAIAWWQNDGSQQFAKHVIDATFEGAGSVFAADVDGDGHVDVIGAAEKASAIAWWRNDGAGKFTRHVIAEGFDVASSVYAVDVDGDGAVDVLGTSWYDGVAWWANDGDAGFSEYVIDGDFSSAVSVYAADVNGDGAVDVLAASEFRNEIAWWEQVGTPDNRPPFQPADPTPSDGAEDQPVDVTLSWAGGDPDAGDSVTYDVYFDTTSPPSLVATVGPYSATQTLVSYDPGPLDHGTEYLWFIVARDDDGATATGETWTFTTEEANQLPYQPADPTPSDGAEDQPVDVALSWAGGDPNAGDTVTYDVYFGTTSPPSLVATVGPYSATQSLVSYDPGPLDHGTEYLWFIVARDDDGATATGETWTFTTEEANQPPFQPADPTPSDGAEDQPVDLALSWAGGDPDAGDSVTYDVYFGTTSPPSLVATVGPYSATQTLVSYDPGPLAYGTEYVWYVVAHDDERASTTGETWTFTTEEEKEVSVIHLPLVLRQWPSPTSQGQGGHAWRISPSAREGRVIASQGRGRHP